MTAVKSRAPAPLPAAPLGTTRPHTPLESLPTSAHTPLEAPPWVLRRLSWVFFALTVVTWCQIAFGGLVRGEQAGLSCPDWPLCHGALVPDLRLEGVVYEYGHRVFATVVSAVYVLGAYLGLREASVRRRFGRALLGLGALLLVQAVMGGLTVLLVHRGDGFPRPETWTVVVHLVLGNTFALLALLLALRFRALARGVPWWSTGGAPRGARWVVGVFDLALALQVIVGGTIAGSLRGMACAEFPTCNGGRFFPTLDGWVGAQLLHRGNGVVLLALGGFLAWRLRGRGLPGTAAAMLPWLLLGQVALGALNIWTHLKPGVTALHSLGAALLLSTAGVMTASLLGARGPAEA
ncbi:MAG: COX15/CtaA family protein [Deltaproteobacteria bacterium]|nr:COX15/CtaA family protein [Deltaproteobacteria bacterium]